MKTNEIESKFREIYDAESDAVFRFCLTRTSDKDLALDFTQDTFMRFWDSLCQEKNIKNCRAFLFAVARNLVIDWYRKKKATSLEAMMSEDSYGKDAILAFDAKIEIDFEAKRLIEKINSLADPYRDAVYLRCVEELKPREIAKIIGESANVVSVRINRGLKELRSLLNENTYA